MRGALTRALKQSQQAEAVRGMLHRRGRHAGKRLRVAASAPAQGSVQALQRLLGRCLAHHWRGGGRPLGMLLPGADSRAPFACMPQSLSQLQPCAGQHLVAKQRLFDKATKSRVLECL